MLRRESLGALVVFSLAACGHSALQPAVPVSTPGAGSSFAVAQPALRTPSPAILKSWAVPTEGQAVAYADLGALFRTELIRIIIASGLHMAGDSISAEAAECIVQWSTAVREGLFWAKDNQGLAVLTYDPTALKAPIYDCVQKLGSLPHENLANAQQAYSLGEGIMVVLPSTVLLGARSLVDASLKGAAPSAWPTNLGLQPEQQLAVIGKEPGQFELQSKLSITADHFNVHTDVTFATPELAQGAAQIASPEQLKQMLSEASPQMQNLAQLITDCWHVKREGHLVRFDFTLQGETRVISERLAMAAAMGIFGVRKYITSAKTAEARYTLGLIARDVGISNPKKLFTLPAVPSQFGLVQGKKYQSSAQDWAKWKPIAFAMVDPQYYQYRIDAAKDGKSAEIIAEGDLNGDGKKSRFSLSITLDPKTHEFTVGPNIEEQNPEE